MIRHLGRALAIVLGCAPLVEAGPKPLAVTISPLHDCACAPYEFGAWHPAWSPDGEFLAVATGNAYPPTYFYWGSVFAMPASETSRQVCVYGDHVAVGFPAWAPDSRRLAFADDVGLGVLDCSVLESPPMRVLIGNAQHPAWSPDGSMLAYEQDGNIWFFQLSAGAPGQLTTQGGSSPAWSPDGGSLAYHADGSIWIRALAEGGPPRRLTEGIDPAWSPDGRWIAFASDRSGNLDIWVIATTGGTAVQVTSSPQAESDPAWAPDQRRLAFTALDDDCSCVHIASELPEDWTVPVARVRWTDVKLLYR